MFGQVVNDLQAGREEEIVEAIGYLDVNAIPVRGRIIYGRWGWRMEEGYIALFVPWAGGRGELLTVMVVDEDMKCYERYKVIFVVNAGIDI